MINNFNFIAPFYDSLARLVFGKSITQAELTFLSEIAQGDQVLILGGGTGKILTALDNLNRQMQITYIDKSPKMIELSQRRRPFKNLSVQYICGDHTQIPNKKYDVVITQFFLDVFDRLNLEVVVDSLYRSLKMDGYWIYADFIKNDITRHKLLIKLMHLFFRLTANLQSMQLLDHQMILKDHGLKILSKKYFYKRMIVSSLFVKPSEI